MTTAPNVWLHEKELPPEGVFIRAPFDKLHASAFQYRKTYNEAGLQELTDNIKATGDIHQPILARRRFPNPLFTEYDWQDGLEIVCGHRRDICGERAGLPDAPVLVKDLDDHQVQAIQITENLQREDVHAIEEAEGFAELMAKHAETADSLAAKFGKSRSYVYGRLKLLALCPEVRKACHAGVVGAEAALLVARLRSHALQEKALAAIKKEYRVSLEDGGKASYRAIRRLLNDKFTLGLDKAIFDIKDTSLVPNCGSCVECPKRTGNAPEFDDVTNPDISKNKHGWRENDLRNEGADVCTDPDCFELKKKAHLKAEASKMEAEGKVVVQGAKARTAIDAFGHLKQGFIKVTDARALLKKLNSDIKPTVLSIQNPRDGKTHLAVSLADLKKAGAPVDTEPKNQASRNAEAAAKRGEEEAQAEARTLLNKARLQQVRAALADIEPSLLELRIVAASLLEHTLYSDDGNVLQELYGVGPAKLEQSVATMDAKALTTLLRDCVLVSNIEQTYWSKAEPDNLLAIAGNHGIALDAAAPTAEEQPTPSTAGASAKKGKARATKKKAAGAPDAAPAAVDDQAEIQTDDAGSAGEKQNDDAGVAGGSDAGAGVPEEAEEAAS